MTRYVTTYDREHFGKCIYCVMLYCNRTTGGGSLKVPWCLLCDTLPYSYYFGVKNCGAHKTDRYTLVNKSIVSFN